MHTLTPNTRPLGCVFFRCSLGRNATLVEVDCSQHVSQEKREMMMKLAHFGTFPDPLKMSLRISKAGSSR